MKNGLDRLGVSLGVICAVHCFALPLLIGALPMVASLEEIPLHGLLLALIVPTAALVLIPAYRKGRSNAMALLGVLGVVLLLVAFAGDEALGESVERWLTLAGGLMVAGAHVINLRSCSDCTPRPPVLDTRERAAS